MRIVTKGAMAGRVHQYRDARHIRPRNRRTPPRGPCVQERLEPRGNVKYVHSAYGPTEPNQVGCYYGRRVRAKAQLYLDPTARTIRSNRFRRRADAARCRLSPPRAFRLPTTLRCGPDRPTAWSTTTSTRIMRWPSDRVSEQPATACQRVRSGRRRLGEPRRARTSPKA